MSKSIKPIFWITGNYYDSRKAWKNILSKLGNCNIENIECGSFSGDGLRTAQGYDIALLLRSRDLFDDRPRIIRMRGLPPDYSVITEHLGCVNDNNILVVDSPVGYFQNKRFVSAATSNFYKTISSNGKVFSYEMDAKNDSMARDWVKSVLSDSGKEIKDDALHLLVEMRGRHYDSLLVEINRLIAYQKNKTICINDVETCCVSVITKTTWDLIDSLDENRFEDSFCHLQKFHNFAGLETGKSFRGEVELLLHALHYHYLLLLFAKDKCCDYLNYDVLSKAVSEYKTKVNDDGTRSASFTSGALMMATRSNSFKKALGWKKSKIYSIYCSIISLIKKNRFHYNEEFCKISLDSLCMYICGILDEKSFQKSIGPSYDI